MSTAMTVQVSTVRNGATVHSRGPALAASTAHGVPLGIRPLCTTCIFLCTAGLAAAADANFADDAMASLQEETTRSSSAYEINSAVLPDFGDYSARDTALSGGLGSTQSSNTQHIDITRWLTPDSPGSFGLSLGLSAPAAGAAPLATDATSAANLDLGVRWRSRLDSGRRLDVSAWARAPQMAQTPDALGMIRQAQQPLYGTRVEVQWASSKTRGLTPEFGAIGVQLQGGSRLVLRAKKGGPMLYYRSKF